ncbi:MAG: CRISPR-associated helicase Cas3' [Isosphaeraceae bacterium]|nr:CRISPR-associated helicase Cas3' [Isosphaeraceae bacterium]
MSLQPKSIGTAHPPKQPLLAKSSKGSKQGRTLVGHTVDVEDAFRALFGTTEQPTELATCWARFFSLSDLRAFLVHGLVACSVHDWGKANDGFQAMLLGKGVQLLRHEQVSALLMHQPEVWDWLGHNGQIDLSVILAAVVGHHLKARGQDFGRPQADIDTIMCVRWDDPDLQADLARLSPASVGGVPDLPKLWSYTPRPKVADLFEALDGVRDSLDRLGDELERDEPRRRLLWAIRAALIVADAAGSGLFREGKLVKQWITEAFDERKRLNREAIRTKVIEPRIKQIGDRWTGWIHFQNACGDSEQVPARALLLAPCGSGKTLAAWRWIEARCDEHEVSRVIFLYPTRGTATEGYRDYASHAGPEEAALVHGTADLEIDDIHPDLSVEDRIKEARLFALQQWPKQLFSATVDQFLGFLQHGYGPTCLLPLLADSVVVFDEVHSYDRGMFSALLDFLRHFNVPVLCMTATLLKRRQDQLDRDRGDLKEQGLKVVNGLNFCGEEGLLQIIANHPRYRIHTATDSDAVAEDVRKALKEGDRVLWVVNTVDRARDIARQFAADPESPELRTDGIPLFCYHSRYRLADRKTWHQRVVGAFGGEYKNRRPVLAVTTQVCEMSLDLDADLLVTEHAPASSLVQRMGRCCRDMKAHEANPPRVGDVILYSPGSPAPYTKQDLLGVDDFVKKLVGAEVVSQSQLEELLSDVPHAAVLPKDCRFIESGPWAASGDENFRDIEDRNREALLPSDVEDYLRLRKGKKPWESQALIISVPKCFIDPEPDKRLPAWLHVTKGGCYLPALGYGERVKPPGPTIF